MLLVIKGKVDDWRIDRIRTYKIVEGFRGSQDMPQLYDFYGLPYDEELREQDKADAQKALNGLEEWYKLAQSELAGITWKN